MFGSEQGIDNERDSVLYLITWNFLLNCASDMCSCSHFVQTVCYCYGMCSVTNILHCVLPNFNHALLCCIKPKSSRIL